MSGHPWLEHAAPYALGALDENERASFEAHLTTCDVCTAEVRELRNVAGLLAMAAPDVAPPPRLRERILADARAVRPISAARTDASPATTSPATTSPERVERGASRSTSGRGALLAWLAAAAAIAFAAYFGQQYRGERQQRLTAEQALAAARAAVDSSTTAVARRDSVIASLVAPDVQTVTVSGSGPSPSARYFLDRRASRIVIATNSLPPAANGRTYQLWGIQTGRPPVSLGTFNTDSSGRALRTLPIPAGLRIAVTAVTDEPSGGSAQPTTTPFLAATWKSE
jgi:anti-sigma-K factor RskA